MIPLDGFEGCFVLHPTNIDILHEAMMLTVWKSHRGCWAGSNELSNSHTFIFESLAHSSQAAARAPPQAALIILLLLPIPPSLTKTCHHFPANVVLMIGDCCCVIWRSLRPCTDGAAPAPCLWSWRRGRVQGRGRRKRKGGGGGESPGADRQQASLLPALFLPIYFHRWTLKTHTPQIIMCQWLCSIRSNVNLLLSSFLFFLFFKFISITVYIKLFSLQYKIRLSVKMLLFF